MRCSTCSHIMENLFKTFNLILFSPVSQPGQPVRQAASDAALDLVSVLHGSASSKCQLNFSSAHSAPFFRTHYFLFHLSKNLEYSVHNPAFSNPDCWPAFCRSRSLCPCPSQQLKQHNCTQVLAAHLHANLSSLYLYLCISRVAFIEL